MYSIALNKFVKLFDLTKFKTIQEIYLQIVSSLLEIKGLQQLLMYCGSRPKESHYN